MCIAIHKPKGVTIPDAYLEESFFSNPDGAGFAVCDPSEGFILRKGFFSLAEFNAEFNFYRQHDALVHFRIATSGGSNIEMCHPFPLCGGRYALIHNGVLNIQPHEGKSDTATFADAVLTPLLEKGVKHDSPALRFLVEQAIGKYNKMLIMDRRGKVAYFNRDSGHVEKGIWYSNHSYRPVQPVLKAPGMTKKDWKPWNGGNARKGILLTDTTECAFCREPIELYSADIYCEACLECLSWREDMLK